MIIFFEDGRTANQLFQYIGLKKYFPNEKLIFFGCKELFKYFREIDVIFLNKNKVMKHLLHIFLRIIFFLLADCRILGSIRECDEPFKKFNLIIKKGFFYNIFVARDIYFQHKDIIDNINKPPLLNESSKNKALKWLHNKKINFDKKNLVFVHVRQGDYKNWPSKKFPAILNFDWYKRSMLLIENKINNPVFIIMGDDHNYINNYFIETETLLISNNDLEVDLYLMSMCSSGVLSPSSFSWWGGFYARYKSKHNGIFIAPNYWGGHRMKKWFPPNFKVNWITYIN